MVEVTGDVASASGGRWSEQKEAPRSTIAPCSKRAQSWAPQECENRRFESVSYVKIKKESTCLKQVLSKNGRSDTNLTFNRFFALMIAWISSVNYTFHTFHLPLFLWGIRAHPNKVFCVHKRDACYGKDAGVWVTKHDACECKDVGSETKRDACEDDAVIFYFVIWL